MLHSSVTCVAPSFAPYYIYVPNHRNVHRRQYYNPPPATLLQSHSVTHASGACRSCVDQSINSSPSQYAVVSGVFKRPVLCNAYSQLTDWYHFGCSFVPWRCSSFRSSGCGSTSALARYLVILMATALSFTGPRIPMSHLTPILRPSVLYVYPIVHIHFSNARP
ncbi:hypothetical protein K503DRAFT_441553 [Rhizopogon vinicolor AM-OR11-026]|uniref:Uncharacterized protein n=1 Tax=Rhizopogon vinicolor AM-OR11-026 TaxID=1314800 RepID=A0A1B7NAC0_9AGAM|nr:hypothetical protein K503DRAFT_441553 [Rhizopogon vinicolor AM-OR11-026]